MQAYDVSIRQHTSAYVSIREHTSAHVNTRQHTTAYVSMRNCVYFVRLACVNAVSNRLTHTRTHTHTHPADPSASASQQEAPGGVPDRAAGLFILFYFILFFHTPCGSLSICQPAGSPAGGGPGTPLLRCQYLYLCTSKASKLSNWHSCRWRRNRGCRVFFYFISC